MKRLVLTFFHFFILSVTAVFADSVAPLLDGWVRHQKDPFNRQCPTYIDGGKDTGQRCQVGCVATALESIVSFYGREVVLQDVLPARSSQNFVTTDIPAGTKVDTRLILSDYGDGTAASVGMSEQEYAASVDEVARLSLMCGMMAQMNWGVGSSGADAGNLVEPLKNIFGWKTAEYIDSYKYTPAQWREILKNELRNGRPILYTGYTVNIGGHAFVIDGFDEDDRFHINWGYGGAYDGNYYDITELATFANPADRHRDYDAMQGFFCNQQALLLSPDEVDLSLAADSLKRTGKEIAIDNIKVETNALTGKYTPVTFTLRNTSDLPLTTPFEVFTNTTYDEDIFRDGDYGALFGVTLEPGERRTMTVPCQFSKKGSRILRVSPDDVTVLGNRTINITTGSNDVLAFDPVEVTFTRESEEENSLISATFKVSVSNESYERSGSRVTYGMMPSTEVIPDGDFRHFDYFYIPAGEQQTSSVTFKGLTPGDEHLFVVRWPWIIRQSCTFTVPSSIVVGVPETLVLHPTTADDAIYDLSGRRTTQHQHGLLIHNGKKTLR